MVPPWPERSTGLLFLFSPFIYIASAQFAAAVTTTTHLAPSHPRECTYLGWTSIILCRGHLPLVKTMRANNVEWLETDANGRNQLGSGQSRSCQMILHHIRWISCHTWQWSDQINIDLRWWQIVGQFLWSSRIWPKTDSIKNGKRKSWRRFRGTGVGSRLRVKSQASNSRIESQSKSVPPILKTRPSPISSCSSDSSWRSVEEPVVCNFNHNYNCDYNCEYMITIKFTITITITTAITITITITITMSSCSSDSSWSSVEEPVVWCQFQL